MSSIIKTDKYGDYSTKIITGVEIFNLFYINISHVQQGYHESHFISLCRNKLIGPGQQDTGRLLFVIFE